MSDIASFLNSKDIADYWRSIGFICTVTYFYGHFCIIVYILLISFCKFFKNTPACAPSICV